MRKLILQMQMSVDGFVASDTAADWQVWGWGGDWPWDERLKADFNATLASVDTILLSRKMAEEGYIGYWAGVADAHAADPDYAFARRIAAVDKVVATTKPTQVQTRWERTSIASAGLAEAVGALKRRDGGDIISFGGAGFGAALLAKNLVDELQLYVNPVAVGAGLSIFSPTQARRLTLIGAEAYDCGVVVSRYRP